jgi:hypothetical protein
MFRHCYRSPDRLPWLGGEPRSDCLDSTGCFDSERRCSSHIFPNQPEQSRSSGWTKWTFASYTEGHSHLAVIGQTGLGKRGLPTNQTGHTIKSVFFIPARNQRFRDTFCRRFRLGALLRLYPFAVDRGALAS